MGSTLAESLEQIWLKKTNFYSQRYIVELSRPIHAEDEQAVQTAPSRSPQTTEGCFSLTDWPFAWLICFIFSICFM